MYDVLTWENPNGWNRLLGKLPYGQQDVYFTPAYYSLYQNYGDGESLCFVFEKDENTAIYPFLINPITPFQIY